MPFHPGDSSVLLSAACESVRSQARLSYKAIGAHMSETNLIIHRHRQTVVALDSRAPQEVWRVEVEKAVTS